MIIRLGLGDMSGQAFPCAILECTTAFSSSPDLPLTKPEPQILNPLPNDCCLAPQPLSITDPCCALISYSTSICCNLPCPLSWSQLLCLSLCFQPCNI